MRTLQSRGDIGWYGSKAGGTPGRNVEWSQCNVVFIACQTDGNEPLLHSFRDCVSENKSEEIRNSHRKGRPHNGDVLQQAVWKFLLGRGGSLKFMVSAVSSSGCSLKNNSSIWCYQWGKIINSFTLLCVTRPSRGGHKTNLLIWVYFVLRGKKPHVLWVACLCWTERAQGCAWHLRCAAQLPGLDAL